MAGMWAGWAERLHGRREGAWPGHREDLACAASPYSPAVNAALHSDLFSAALAVQRLATGRSSERARSQVPALCTRTSRCASSIGQLSLGLTLGQGGPPGKVASSAAGTVRTMDPLVEGDPRRVGSYRIHARLGSGGMGRVYLASSPGGRTVAVKIIHPELAHDQAFLTRFRHEVTAARQVSSAYTAPVVDASGDGEDPPWLATALVPGPSLADLVPAHGPLAPESLWRLAAGLAEALAAIHTQGLVHRDLKPPNVLLATDGPRVIDFGISRALDATTATTTGMIIGTPSFMSPEQAEGIPAGTASDVFSLGCVLAYAATGTGPFGTGTPASIIYRIVHTQPALDGIYDPLRDLVTRCLAKEPAERATLAELMDLITAQPLPTTPALSFWPPDLADAITSYQAQLASAAPTTDSPEPSGGSTQPPHAPTRLAALHQQHPNAEVTITARHPSQATPSPRPPAETHARVSRKPVILTAAGIGAAVLIAAITALTLTMSSGGSLVPASASCAQQLVAWKNTPGAKAISDAATVLQSTALDAKALNYAATAADLNQLGAAATIMQGNPQPSCADPQDYWQKMIQKMQDAAAQSSGVANQNIAAIQRTSKDMVNIGNDANTLTRELQQASGQ